MSTRETFTDPRVPANAHRVHGFLSIAEINGGDMRPGEVLNLHNVIFLSGGSLLWLEQPATLAVMHVEKSGEIDRYEGTWEAREVPDDH